MTRFACWCVCVLFAILHLVVGHPEPAYLAAAFVILALGRGERW